MNPPHDVGQRHRARNLLHSLHKNNYNRDQAGLAYNQFTFNLQGGFCMKQLLRKAGMVLGVVAMVGAGIGQAQNASVVSTK